MSTNPGFNMKALFFGELAECTVHERWCRQWPVLPTTTTNDDPNFSSFVLWFRNVLRDDPDLIVPEVIPELSTKQILTTELVDGVSLDKAVDLDQETRNDVSARQILLLFKKRIMAEGFNGSVTMSGG